MSDQLVINLPTGVGPIRTSYNRWLIGLLRVKINGNGASLQPITNDPDDIPQRLLYNGETTQNNAPSYGGTKLYTVNDLIEPVAAGSKVVRLKEPGAAANIDKYRPGTRVKIFSEDTEGDNGYPPACAKDELTRTLVSVDVEANELHLDAALAYDHTDDQRDYPGTSGGHSGPPCIQSQDRRGESEGEGFTLADTIEIDGLTGLPATNGGAGGLILAARRLIIRNVVTDHHVQPSENDEYLLEDFDILNGEMDKRIHTGIFRRGRVRGQLGNGRWRDLLMEDVTFTTSGFNPGGDRIRLVRNDFFAGVVKNQGQADDWSLGSLFPQPGHRPVHFLSLQGGSFSSHPLNTAKGHITFMEHDTFEITAVDGTTNILLPWGIGHNDKNFDPWRRTCVGMGISNLTGTKGGTITRRWWDDTASPAGQHLLAYTGPAFELGEKIVWSYVQVATDAQDYERDPNKPTFAPNSMRWQGNTAESGPFTTRLTQADIFVGTPTLEIVYFAFIDQVVVNVTQASTANNPILEINLNPESIGGPRRTLCTINLSQVGSRTISASGVSGAQPGDTFDAGAAGLWADKLEYYYPREGGQFNTAATWHNFETHGL